jgi:hypothetical protein
MTIEETIKKAEEGGWKNTIAGSVFDDYWQISTFDLLFWQSLAKAVHFDGSTNQCPVCGMDTDELFSGGRELWHRLVDHLSNGGTAESYFETLK